MVMAKRLCVIGGISNIIIPVMIFAIGAISDSGGSSFGFIFIGFAIFGVISFLYHLIILTVFRTGIFKSTEFLMLVILTLAVNTWEVSLIKDFALWD